MPFSSGVVYLSEHAVWMCEGFFCVSNTLLLWDCENCLPVFKNVDRCCDRSRCSADASEKNPFQSYLEIEQGTRLLKSTLTLGAN